MSRRTRHIIIVVITVMVVLAAFFTVTSPPSPDGHYVVEKMLFASMDDYYYELSGGKVYELCYLHSGATNRADTSMRYIQKPDGWYLSPRYRVFLWSATNTPAVKIQCSWSGLTLTYGTGKTEFWRRRLIPGKRPEWMTRYLPWWVQ